MFKCLNVKMKEKAFTLIELLVVIGVIVILSGIVLVSFRSGEKQLVLQRAASKLALDIRRTQEMAMSAKECDVCGGGVPPGYGILFTTGGPADAYLMFADLNDDQKFNAADKLVESIAIEEGVITDALSLGVGVLTIVFTSPDPTTSIYAFGFDFISSGWIRLCIEGADCKTITVNEVGLIEID